MLLAAEWRKAALEGRRFEAAIGSFTQLRSGLSREVPTPTCSGHWHTKPVYYSLRASAYRALGGESKAHAEEQHAAD